MSGDETRSEEEDEAEARESEERIAAYIRLGVPSATLAGAVAAGIFQGPAAVVLVLAAGALVGVIAIFWSSVRTLVGETPLSGADAYALGAPRAEEEQKRAVLRALKDLDFERSVGKLTTEDYDVLVARYRAEGKRLIRVLDDEAAPRRAKVESMVHDRLVDAGLLDAAQPPEAGVEKPVQSSGEKASKKKKKGDRAAAVVVDSAPVCSACATKNDPDAAFCKKCGASLAAKSPSAESTS